MTHSMKLTPGVKGHCSVYWSIFDEVCRDREREKKKHNKNKMKQNTRVQVYFLLELPPALVAMYFNKMYVSFFNTMRNMIKIPI